VDYGSLWIFIHTLNYLFIVIASFNGREVFEFTVFVNFGNLGFRLTEQIQSKIIVSLRNVTKQLNPKERLS
jgi:hypothetical protein